MMFLAKIWSGIKSAANWLWARPILLASLASAIVGGVFVLRSKKNQIDNLKDAVEVQRAKASIARSEAKAESLEVKASEAREKVVILKQDIEVSRKRVASIINEDISGMDDNEIAHLFTSAGL